ncbi:hypothetical protein MRX96_029303 [Rhipicephalus microplus]
MTRENALREGLKCAPLLITSSNRGAGRVCSCRRQGGAALLYLSWRPTRGAKQAGWLAAQSTRPSSLDLLLSRVSAVSCETRCGLRRTYGEEEDGVTR